MRQNDAIQYRYRCQEISEEYGKIDSKHALFFVALLDPKNDSVQ